MTKQTIQSVPFDPGFGRYFPQIDETVLAHLEGIARLKVPNQRKFQLQKIETTLTRELITTMCIYYGCVLYGSTIASKYVSPSAIITENPVAEIPEEQKQDIDLTIESSFIAEVYKLFSRSIEFNFRRKCKIPQNFLDVVQAYSEFMQVNNHFVNIKTTDQLKIPEKFSHFKSYDKKKLDEIEQMIFQAVEAGRLEELLNIS